MKCPVCEKAYRDGTPFEKVIRHILKNHCVPHSTWFGCGCGKHYGGYSPRSKGFNNMADRLLNHFRDHGVESPESYREHCLVHALSRGVS